MRTERIGMVGAIAGVVLGGLVAAAGCVGADDEVSGGDEAEAELQSGFGFHRPHRRRDAGTVGTGVAGTTGGGAGPVTGAGGTTGGGTAGTNGTTGGDAVADCDICTQAQQCCEALGTLTNCTFSAATCASMSDAAQPGYVSACRTHLVAVRGTWGGNPPAACR